MRLPSLSTRGGSSIILTLLILPPTNAQLNKPNGTIVPFASLNTCASICDVLSDVQTSCSPPVQPAVNKTCFCTDPRLYAFATRDFSDTFGLCVQGLSSCTNKAMLGVIADWYTRYCSGDSPTVTTAPKSSLPAGVATVLGTVTWFSETSSRSSRTGTLPWGVASVVSGDTYFSGVGVLQTVGGQDTVSRTSYTPSTGGGGTTRLATTTTTTGEVGGVGLTSSSPGSVGSTATSTAASSATSSATSSAISPPTSSVAPSGGRISAEVYLWSVGYIGVGASVLMSWW